MNSRDRVSRVLSGGIPDRVPMDDSYWQTTIERWQREGLPAGVSPHDHFGTNEIVCIGGDYTMQFPERVLESSDTMRRYWDSDGALRRDLHVAEGWTSQWLDFTIKTREDWLQHRHRMVFSDTRISGSALESYHRARADGRFVCYSAHACFHPTWMRIGMENLLMGMLDRPDFIRELLAAHAQLVIDIYEGMRRIGIEFDGARLADDLGYRTAPLISPALYRALVYPHHKRLCDHFNAHGLKTFLHSDGRVAPLIPHFIEAGIDGLHPLEAKAGMDVRELKRQYGGRVALFGGIDVRLMEDPDDSKIENEIREKFAVAKEGGGYLYHSDHSVPPTVSFEKYQFIMKCVRKYGEY